MEEVHGTMITRTTPMRRQPITPLIVLAFVTLLVAAPAALSGNGQSANPIVIMHSIARTTYTLTGLLSQSNSTLSDIRGNITPLADLNSDMSGIAEDTQGMNEKTKDLAQSLASVGASVGQSRAKLTTVDEKLVATADGLGSIETAITGSLTSTRAIVTQFGAIGVSIKSMNSNLGNVIRLIGTSAPLTRAFSQNTTRISVAGGDGTKFKVPNVLPGNKVMSVILPMIDTMQSGGALPTRKDSAEASNILVKTLLAKQVPDGTNVTALIRPFDGFYGLPAKDFFVNNKVNGF